MHRCWITISMHLPSVAQAPDFLPHHAQLGTEHKATLQSPGTLCERPRSLNEHTAGLILLKAQ